MAVLGAVDWAGIFTPDQSLLESFVRGSLAYLSIVVLFRLAMRRQGGSIGLPDIMLVVLVSECVSSALSANSQSLPNGLAAVGALLFWSFVLDRLGHRWPWFQRLLEPPPLPIVRNGQLLREHLDREGITDDELTAQLRLQGLEDLSKVKLATLESGGEVSVVPVEKDDHDEPPTTSNESDDSGLRNILNHYLRAAERLRHAVARHEQGATNRIASAKAASDLLDQNGLQSNPIAVSSHTTESPR